MEHLQYLHHVKHVRLRLDTDEKRGRDTLNIEFVGDDGSHSQLAIFFYGEASVEGATLSSSTP